MALVQVAPLGLSVILLTVIILLLGRRISKLYTLADIPGPPASGWFLGHSAERETAVAGTLYNVWASKYGPTYKLKGAFGTSQLIVGDPKGSNYILNSHKYARPTSSRYILAQWFGEGLFTAEGEEHRQQRAVLNAAFTQTSVREVSDVLIDLAHELASSWEDELDSQVAGTAKTIEITHQIHGLALDAISKTAFAYDFGRSDQSIPALLAKISDVPQKNNATLFLGALVNLFPSLINLPNPMKNWATTLRTGLGKIADDVWETDRSAGMHSKLLDSMYRSQDITGKPLSRDLAIAQIVGVLFAGHESTANVIAECLYELSRNPHIQTHLRNELLLFSHINAREPSYDDLMSASQFPYLDAVTRETMRTKAVLYVITRESTVQDEIALEVGIQGSGRKSVIVEPGQIIQIPVRDGINVDPILWGDDAHDFRPERWIDSKQLPEAVKGIRAPGHIMTFGDGSKICLGRHFALAEFKIVISVLVRRLIFEPDGQDYIFRRDGGNTIKPRLRGRVGDGPQLHLRMRRFQVD